MVFEEGFEGYTLKCDVIRMGNDYTLAVYGGEKPHVGSVAMAIARPSLTGEGVGVTSSVVNAVGHKDEAVGRLFAEEVARSRRCTAVCSCGIHIDHIRPEQIKHIRKVSRRLLRRVLEELKKDQT